jgi:hypothetical protein
VGGILGTILSAIISLVLPLIVNLLKTHAPSDTTRAQARQWVKDMLDELFDGLNTHGLVPHFLWALEDPIESIFASKIDQALDSIGW